MTEKDLYPTRIVPDGPVPFDSYAHIVQTLDAALVLTPQQEAFLLEPDNEPFLQDLHNFWYFCDKSEESKDRALDAVDARMEGYGIVSLAPMVKYPPNSNYENLYPKFTQYLKNELPEIANNQTVINEIHNLTEAPKGIIKEALQWGKGPAINIIQLGGQGDDERLGSYRGHVDPSQVNVLNLDVDLISQLESSETIEMSNAFSFLVAVTILHEYTHLTDFVFSDNFWGDAWVESGFLDENEAGILFEEAVFGEKIFISNAGAVLKRTGGL